MIARRARAVLVPVALLATGACVATQNDLRLVQNDIAVLKAEQAQADSARRAQLDRVIAQLGMVTDSMRVLGARTAAFQADSRQQLYDVAQQLVTIQELTGQSQRRLQELRASVEARGQALSAAPATPAAGAVAPAAGGPVSPAQPGAGAAPGTPGPNQLFQLALDQLRRGSTGAARTGFEELLRQYPTADVAPDAQYYVAESYATEGNAAAADSVYASVVTRYPASPRAATALYKRAVAAQAAGRAEARALLESVVAKYPRSDEAALARDRLKNLK